MKILITGGTGFIGAHLAKFCCLKGNDVHICDNNARGQKDDFIIDLIDNHNVKFIKMDLTKPDEVDCLDLDYDIVFHLAAINGTENFYNIPYSVFEVALKSTMNLIEHFKGNTKFIFTSSSEVYAGTIKEKKNLVPTPETVPCTIDNVLNERFSYGGSKLACEIMINSYHKQNSMDYQIIRYHNVYGPRMGTKHVMPQFIKRAKSGEQPFKIYGSDQTRAFCFIDDAVEATYLLAMKDVNGIFHIGNDLEEVEIMEVAKIVNEFYSPVFAVSVEKAPEGSVSRRCPDLTKLKKTIDYNPKVDLVVGLNKTIEWYDVWYNKNTKTNGVL
jgi:UDP-glucose 4-epimerase